MRYASIRNMDISNGENVGVALFVQGCYFHCYNCFNSETWDFQGGQEWSQDEKEKFLKLVDRSYIKRVSILGGEPLAEKNLDDILDLVTDINKHYNISCCSKPNKTIWLYTGYRWEHIFDIRWHYHPQTQEKLSIGRWRRQQIIKQCDVLIDGRYIDSQRDITLAFRGSKNQRVIDVQKTLKSGEVVLWTT